MILMIFRFERGSGPAQEPAQRFQVLAAGPRAMAIWSNTADTSTSGLGWGLVRPCENRLPPPRRCPQSAGKPRAISASVAPAISSTARFKTAQPKLSRRSLGLSKGPAGERTRRLVRCPPRRGHPDSPRAGGSFPTCWKSPAPDRRRWRSGPANPFRLVLAGRT